MGRPEIVVIILVLAGCSTPAQDAISTLHYVIEEEGREIGSLAWIPLRFDVDLLDASGAPRAGSVVLARFAVPGIDVNSSFVIDPASGEDIAVINDCDLRSSCSHALVEWGDPSAPAVWLGSAALSGVDADVIRVAGVERKATITSNGDVLTIVPDPAPRSIPGMCNLLDDRTEVDTRRRVVLRCEHEDGAVFRLDASGRLPSFTARRASPAPFVAPESSEGPLPPGLPLPYQEAHAGALEASEQFRRFLADHSEALLVGAESKSREVDDQVVVESHAVEHLLRYAAAQGAGYEIDVVRTERSVAGTPVPPLYTILSEGAWVPPSRWEASARPVSLAPVQMAVERIAAVVPGWTPVSVNLHDDARPDAVAPLLRYYVSLRTETCEEGADTCVTADVVIVDAASGRLEAAQLSGARLSAFLAAKG